MPAETKEFYSSMAMFQIEVQKHLPWFSIRRFAEFEMRLLSKNIAEGGDLRKPFEQARGAPFTRAQIAEIKSEMQIKKRSASLARSLSTAARQLGKKKPTPEISAEALDFVSRFNEVLKRLQSKA